MRDCDEIMESIYINEKYYDEIIRISTKHKTTIDYVINHIIKMYLNEYGILKSNDEDYAL